MSSIKKRIAQLEVSKTKAEHRPLTNTERTVRALAILNNPESPQYAKLIEFFESRSEVFRRMRLNEIPPKQSTHDK